MVQDPEKAGVKALLDAGGAWVVVVALGREAIVCALPAGRQYHIKGVYHASMKNAPDADLQ